MIVYRGDSMDNFEVQEWTDSRYGFRALFFASNKYLARLFAHHHASEKFISSGGFVYEFEISDNLKIVDFDYKLSYNAEFRSLIYKLHRVGEKGVIIKNVMDYPSKLLQQPTLSDIVILFDFDLIKKFSCIEKNVKVKL